jgi:guanylate kinase
LDKQDIIVVTGPRLVGKTTFLTSLESIMKEQDISTSRIVKATTRPQRDGEIDGLEFKFCSPDEWENLCNTEKIVGPYKMGEHRYGLFAESLTKKSDYKIVVLGNPAGLVNLNSIEGYNIIPILLYAENQDIGTRVAQRLRNADVNEDEVKARLVDFDKDFPVFIELIDRYKYVLFNPNIPNIKEKDITRQLAYRAINAITMESADPLTNRNHITDIIHRDSYINTLLTRLCNCGLNDILLNRVDMPKLTISDDVIKKYSNENNGRDYKQLKSLVPEIIGISAGHGIVTVYIEQDDKNKSTIADLIEMQLKEMPQFRSDETVQTENSIMGLTHFEGHYSNFWLSYSAAYDSPVISKREADIHTLIIEGVYLAPNERKRVYRRTSKERTTKILSPEDANKAWEMRRRVIDHTRLPYTFY